MKFTLEINLGNDVMQTGADVGYAIERVAERIQFEDMTPEASGVILDTNGNTVGAWSVHGADFLCPFDCGAEFDTPEGVDEHLDTVHGDDDVMDPEAYGHRA